MVSIRLVPNGANIVPNGPVVSDERSGMAYALDSTGVILGREGRSFPCFHPVLLEGFFPPVLAGEGGYQGHTATPLGGGPPLRRAGSGPCPLPGVQKGTQSRLSCCIPRGSSALVMPGSRGQRLRRPTNGTHTGVAHLRLRVPWQYTVGSIPPQAGITLASRCLSTRGLSKQGNQRRTTAASPSSPAVKPGHFGERTFALLASRLRLRT